MSICLLLRALPPSTYDIQLKTRSGNMLQECLDFELFRFTQNVDTKHNAQQWVTALTQETNKLLDWGLEEVYFYGKKFFFIDVSIMSVCVCVCLCVSVCVQLPSFKAHVQVLLLTFDWC